MVKKLVLLLTILLAVIGVSGCIDDDIPDTGGGDIILPDDGDTEDELNTEWDDKNAIHITFTDSSASVTGLSSQFYTVSKANVTISATSAQTYVISGNSSDGRVVFDAKNADHIVLNGLTLSSKVSAPLSLMKNTDRVLTVAKDTINTLSDSSVYTLFDNTAGDEPNAALFSKGSLTINGSGTLNVNGNNNNGIGSKSTLKILNTNISVTAVNNGIKGNDAVIIKNATLNVRSDEDGIKSDAVDIVTSDPLGYIHIQSSDIFISTTQDAVQGAELVYIESGNFRIDTGGGAAKNVSNASTESAKGIRSDANIQIDDGYFVMDCYDDAFHAYDTINIKDGEFLVLSGDDAIHADIALNIHGGKINISQCYEGIEAANVTIYDGDVTIIAKDDGISATDGTTNTPGNSSKNCLFLMEGGALTITAAGDAIDSNGTLTIKGGIVTLHGPSTNNEGALDADGGIYINGGTVYAAGPNNLMNMPSSDSSQYILIIYISAGFKKDSVISVKDGDGNELFSYKAVKTNYSLILSSDAILKGSTVNVYQDSTLYRSTTISSIVTSIGGPGGGGRP